MSLVQERKKIDSINKKRNTVRMHEKELLEKIKKYLTLGKKVCWWHGPQLRTGTIVDYGLSWDRVCVHTRLGKEVWICTTRILDAMYEENPYHKASM